MGSVALLADLNEIDLAIDSIKARLAEVAAGLREPAELQAGQRALAQAEAELARCRTTQSESEEAQGRAADKLAQAQDQLYKGKGRTHRELEDAEKDVQQLRRQSNQAEDGLLEALIVCEDAAKIAAEQRSRVAQLSADWEASRTSLRTEQARLNERLTAEQSRRANARQSAPADLLAVYDHLRPRRGGKVVAELDGGTCSVCLVAASPSRVAAARDSDDLVYCENCGRLLYWPE